jgi:hypothetical protein
VFGLCVTIKHFQFMPDMAKVVADVPRYRRMHRVRNVPTNERMGHTRSMPTKILTVDAYLASLPDDRRAAIEAVRKVIRKNLDAHYEEGIQYGMLGYYVSHAVYPAGYHTDPKQPLPFLHVASQKSHMAVYLMGVYSDPGEEKWFHDAWARTGKRLDMGKSCVRFKKLEDLALDVLGEAVRRVPAKLYIARYEKLRPPAKKKKS